jgi:hypothetical protein
MCGHFLRRGLTTLRLHVCTQIYPRDTVCTGDSKEPDEFVLAAEPEPGDPDVLRSQVVVVVSMGRLHGWCESVKIEAPRSFQDIPVDALTLRHLTTSISQCRPCFGLVRGVLTCVSVSFAWTTSFRNHPSHLVGCLRSIILGSTSRPPPVEIGSSHKPESILEGNFTQGYKLYRIKHSLKSESG